METEESSGRKDSPGLCPQRRFLLEKNARPGPCGFSSSLWVPCPHPNGCHPRNPRPDIPASILGFPSLRPPQHTRCERARWKERCVFPGENSPAAELETRLGNVPTCHSSADGDIPYQ